MNPTSPARKRFIAAFVCVLSVAALLFVKGFFVSQAQKRDAKTQAAALVPIIGATDAVTEVTGLSNSDGNADPGETLEYTVTINNTGADPATGVTLDSTLQNITTLAPGSVNIGPIAVNETFSGIGNVNMVVPDGAGDLLTNDTDPDGAGVTLTGFGNTLGTAAANAPGATIASGNGGSLQVLANGAFNYNPPRGLTTTETFFYTVADAGGVTDTAQVTINLSGKIWFVNNNAGACVSSCDGRLTNPYTTLEAFRAVNTATSPNPGANDTVFIYASATAYNLTTLYTWLNGQRMVGQGASSTLLSITGLSTPSGTNQLPSTTSDATAVTLTSTASSIFFTLAQNNTLRGFTIGNTAGTKLNGTNVGNLTLGNNTTPDLRLMGTGKVFNLTTGTFTSSGLTSVATTSSATHGMAIVGFAGSIGFGSTAVSGSTTQGIFIHSSTADINLGNTTVTGSGAGTEGVRLEVNTAGTRTFGTLTITNASNQGMTITGGGNVSVTGLTTITNPGNIGILANATPAGSAVTFANAVVNDSGSTGVSLSNNDGPITFADLDIDTDANVRAFQATNSTGLITTTSGTIADTGTATAIDIVGPSAASRTPLNMQLTSVSANGGASGIILTNTSASGSPGGFTILGSGGVCTSAATCTGGAIQNTTGDGVSLNSATKIAFTRLFINNTSVHGIDANAVNGSLTTNGLTLTGCFINDSGDADNEYGMNLVNLTNTVTIDGTTFNGAADNLVYSTNTGALTFNVNNSSAFSYPASVSGTANSAILLEPSGSGAVTASIQNSTFTNIVSASAQIGSNTVGANGTHNFNFSNNTISVTLAARGSGVVVSGQELTTTNITIDNNNFTGAGGNGVISLDTNDTSIVKGTASGNTITSPPGIGIFVAVDEAGKSDVTLNGNTITNSGGDGIQTVNFGGAGVSLMDNTITNNNVNGHSLNTAVNFVGGIAAFALSAPPDAGDAMCVVHRGNSVTGTPASPTQCGGAPCDDHHFEEVAGQMTYEEIPNTGGTTLNAAYVNSINDAGPVSVFGFIDLTNGGTCNVTGLGRPSGADFAEVVDNDFGKKLSLPNESAESPLNSLESVSDQIASAGLEPVSSSRVESSNGIALLTRISDLASEIAGRLDSLIQPTVYSQENKRGEGVKVVSKGRLSPESGEAITTTPTFTLPAGESVKIVYRATVDQGPYAAGINNIDNQATISGSNFANVPTNTASIPLDAAPDLQVVATDLGATTQPGGTVTYTLNYLNVVPGGPPVRTQGGTGVAITANVPANSTFNAGVSSPGWSCADNAPAATPCTFNIGTIVGGGNGAATFAVNVLGALPAGAVAITPTATIAEVPANTNGTDLNIADNTSNETTNIIGNWDGSGGTDWFTAANWSNDVVPVAGQNVSIPNVANQPVVVGPDVTVNNLVLNGENVTINATRTINVNGAVTLGANVVDGAGTLALGGAATITRTTGRVESIMRKTFTAPGPMFVFPVGTTSGYSPLDVTVTGGAGDLTVDANSGVAPMAPPLNPATTLGRYWSLSGTGITANMVFHYLPGDVAGTEANYRIIRVTGGNTAIRYPQDANTFVSPASDSFTVMGLSSFSDWTAGEALAPTAANVPVAGRVTTIEGRGIGGARVIMTDENGNTRTALTNPFGYYNMGDVEAGRSYTFNVADKTFVFVPRIITVQDELTDLDFTGTPREE